MSSQASSSDVNIASAPQLSHETWYIFKDHCIALIESKDFLKFCDGSFEEYMSEVITSGSGKNLVRGPRKSHLSEDTRERFRAEEVKATGLLRLLSKGVMFDTISKLKTAKEIWNAILKEFRV
jgi:hypothetical protein